jgi:hypothetical protein
MLPTSTGAPRRPWLVGPVPDLLLGCGLGYLLLIVALAIVRPQMAGLQPWLPLLILVTGVPHYGATLVRAYGTAEARQRYVFHGVVLSAAVWLVFVGAAYWAALGCLMITVYLSFSPWHYGAQNYGLCLMFLGRAGVRLPGWGRRMLFASFALSVALTLLNFHRVLSVGGADPMFDPGSAYRFVPLGIPEGVARAAFPALLAAYAASLLVLGWLLRGAPLRSLVPAIAIVLAQATWFAIPAVLGHAFPGLLERIGVPAAFIWIAVGHSVQYLWVTRHYARADGAEAFWGTRVLLAGAAIWVLPALAFAPGALGRVPFEAGLGLLVAAAVNLHHFVLDGAIWKLRDPRVGGVLVDGGARAVAPDQPRRAPVFANSTLVTVGVFSVACWVATTWEKEVGYRRSVAAGDLARLRIAAERLKFLGRDGPRLQVALGRLAQARGDLTAAREAYQAALAFAPGRTSIRKRLDEVRTALDRAPTAAPPTAGR